MRANKFSKFNKIRYKDLAIAVALSGASLLLVPTTAQADATNTSQTQQAHSSVVQTENTSNDSSLFDNTTVGSITPNLSELPEQTVSNSTYTTNVNTSTSTNDQSTDNTDTSVSNLASTATQPTSTTSTTSATAVATMPATQTTPSTESLNLTDTTTEPQQPDYSMVDNTVEPAAVIPENGITVQNEPNSTLTNGKYSISIQGVNNYGEPYGKSAIIGYAAPNSSAQINWSPELTSIIAGTMGTNSTYTSDPWRPDYSATPLQIQVTNSNVMISVYFARPAMSATFIFYDETTNKPIVEETRPYSFHDYPNFQTYGIQPPMDVLSDGTLTAVDQSEYNITNPSMLPYFGPTGMILNSSYYVLDLQKSGNVTPLDYIQWPTDSFTKTFYYKEATAPTVTVDAVNQFGDLLKTFSTTQLNYSTKTISADQLLPDSSELNIANNTFSGINVIESNSISGQSNKTTNYQMTPSQYANYLQSNDAQTQNDIRLLGDYQNIEVQLAYTDDTVPLYIQPVDPQGNNVGDPIPVGTGSIGQNATIFAPTVTGYAAQTPSVTITVQPDQGPIDFPYISATDINPNDGGTYLYSGKFGQIPANGIKIVNTGTVSTDTTADHTISVQAVDTDGNPLGALIPVTSATANSTAVLDWTPSLIKQLNNSVNNVSQYELWNADALTGSLNVPVQNQDVVVDVVYALPQVTTTYNFIDSNTGKTLLTETNTWNLDDPDNGYTFKTQGIRPPMTIIDPDSHQLVADDPSENPVTDPADLPFFGPSGTVFNTGAYQLNSLMSGLTTPTRYENWPSANITQNFYYMEEPDPTITVDAADQNGNIIKTFPAPTIVSTLPAPQLSQTDYFPTADQATINGYTLTGFKINATGSYFGGTDTDYSYSMTPDEYAQFISSPSAQMTMDERALAAHQNFHVQLLYQGNTVNLTVQPVDENGVQIGTPISVGSGTVGSTSTITAPQIAGYQAVEPTTTVNVTPDQSSVSITYMKDTVTDSSSNTSDSTNTENSSSTATDPSDPVNTGSTSSTTTEPATSDPINTGNSSSTITDPSDPVNTGSTSSTTTEPTTSDPTNTGTNSSTITDPSDPVNTGSTSSTTTEPATSGSTSDPTNTETSSSTATGPSDPVNTGSTSNNTTGPTTSGSTSDPTNTGTSSGTATGPSDPVNTGSTSSTTTEPTTSGSTSDPANTGTSSGTATDPSNPVNTGSTSSTTTEPTTSGSTSDPINTGTSSNTATDPSTTSSTSEPTNTGASSSIPNDPSSSGSTNTGSNTGTASGLISDSANNESGSSTAANNTTSGSASDSINTGLNPSASTGNVSSGSASGSASTGSNTDVASKPSIPSDSTTSGIYSSNNISIEKSIHDGVTVNTSSATMDNSHLDNPSTQSNDSIDHSNVIESTTASTQNNSYNKESGNENKLNSNSKLDFNSANENSKLPQTGNKFALILSGIGVAMLGIMAFCGKKIKKLL